MNEAHETGKNLTLVMVKKVLLGELNHEDQSCEIIFPLCINANCFYEVTVLLNGHDFCIVFFQVRGIPLSQRAECSSVAVVTTCQHAVHIIASI